MAELSRRSPIALAAAAPVASRAAVGDAPSKLSDIDHFIILMNENCSFGHYFGTLRGVRGFDDPPPRSRTAARSSVRPTRPIPTGVPVATPEAAQFCSNPRPWPSLEASGLGDGRQRIAPEANDVASIRP